MSLHQLHAKKDPHGSFFVTVAVYYRVEAVFAALQKLGHVNSATALHIYTHLADEAQMKDADKVRRAFR